MSSQLSPVAMERREDGPGGIIEATPTHHEVLSDLSVLRIIGFGAAEEALEADQGGFEGEDGGPCVLENVETNCS